MPKPNNEQIREAARQDAARIIEAAREASERLPARQVASEWDFENGGIYTGPHAPPGALVSETALEMFRAGEGTWSLYWDLVELELRRGEVALILGRAIHFPENTPFHTLYAVDEKRFKSAKQVTLIDLPGGGTAVPQDKVQHTYVPRRKRRPWSRGNWR